MNNNMYECKYCGTLCASEKICIEHEKFCLNNPSIKACNSCDHYIKQKSKYFNDLIHCRYDYKFHWKNCSHWKEKKNV